MTVGASYFGSRIPRHVAADMRDLADKGFTGVLHTFSENDWRHYPRTMADIVATSQAAGLEVQVNPWGLGLVFGGEADSWFAAAHPECGQVLDDGRRVGAACPNQPAFRRYVRRWIDAAVGLGADRVFLDEPSWVSPARVDAPADRWACVCEACRAVFRDHHGGPLPRERTDEVVRFREACLVDLVTELVAYTAAAGGRPTVCLLPPIGHDRSLTAWGPVAESEGLDTLATDPYWGVFDQPAASFVGSYAAHVRRLAVANGVRGQLWIKGFGLGPEDADDVHAAVAAARAAGVDDLWVWAYEAAGHMDSLGTREPARVWQTLVAALTGRAPDPSA